MADQAMNLDALAPAAVAQKTESVGVTKANLPFGRTTMLGILAGAYIALAAMFYETVTSDMTGFGLPALVGGIVFTLGLILVVVGGAELFTGNTLLSMAYLSRKITLGQLLKNWLIVWVANFVGAVIIVLLAFYAQHWNLGANAVGAKALTIAVNKASYPSGELLARGIMANFLVCLAVWLAYAGRSATDKILGMLFPISAFIAMGFEHSVANMFYLPYGLLLKGNAAVVKLANLPAAKLDNLTLGGMVHNLIPVTLGNIIGGAIFVGATYWIAYLSGEKRAEAAQGVAANPAATR